MRTARRRPGMIVAVLVGIVGLIGAGTALAGSPSATDFQNQPLVPFTPCTVTAKACVDLDSKRSWLIQDGKIFRGPVPVATGGPGHETPVGHSLRVYRKEQLHTSSEYRLTNGEGAPMPWATFFEDGGIAFHEGRTDIPSGGCVRLSRDDAIAWFNHLQIGDQVQVVSNAQVMADRGMAPPPPPPPPPGK